MVRNHFQLKMQNTHVFAYFLTKFPGQREDAFMAEWVFDIEFRN